MIKSKQRDSLNPGSDSFNAFKLGLFHLIYFHLGHIVANNTKDKIFTDYHPASEWRVLLFLAQYMRKKYNHVHNYLHFKYQILPFIYDEKFQIKCLCAWQLIFTQEIMGEIQRC